MQTVISRAADPAARATPLPEQLTARYSAAKAALCGVGGSRQPQLSSMTVSYAWLSHQNRDPTFCRVSVLIYLFLCHFKGAGVKLIILASLIDEGLVIALLDDFTIFQNNNVLGISHRGKPVRDDKDGAVLHDLVHA